MNLTEATVGAIYPTPKQLPPIGTAVRLRPVGHRTLPGTFSHEFHLSRSDALKFLENLGVPLLHLGTDSFFWIHALEQCLAALLEPGGPGIAAPNSVGWFEDGASITMPPKTLESIQRADPARLLHLHVASTLYASMDREAISSRLEALYGHLSKSVTKKRK